MGKAESWRQGPDYWSVLGCGHASLVPEWLQGCISELESNSGKLKYLNVIKLLDLYILILATQTQRQENSKSEANLGSLARLFLKIE